MSASPNLRHQWAKGQSGNPSGRKPLPPELRLINVLTPHELAALVSKYARMDRITLQAAALSTTTPMLEVTIASIFAKAASTGDPARLDFLLNRSIGKAPTIPDEVDPDGELSKLTDAELVARIRRFLPKLEKTG